MKVAFFLFCISFTLYARHISHPIPKVIYGVDDRLDIYQAPNPMYVKLADSTAAMIDDSALKEQGDSVLIEGTSFENDYKMCPGSRFKDQPTVAMCSGFLVGTQYLLTAGHCITKVQECASRSWVFGYGNMHEEKTVFNIANSEVYKCVELTERAYDSNTGNDYSLVKLDRPVVGHEPLKFRTEGVIADNAKLVVMGHPSGLPTKIADNAYVRNNSSKYFFQTNLDTFSKNSGSAVFDAETGIVEGILVRGESDFDLQAEQNCSIPKVCPMDGCRGEDVTRVTNVKALLAKRIK